MPCTLLRNMVTPLRCGSHGLRVLRATRSCTAHATPRAASSTPRAASSTPRAASSTRPLNKSDVSQVLHLAHSHRFPLEKLHLCSAPPPPPAAMPYLYGSPYYSSYAYPYSYGAYSYPYSYGYSYPYSYGYGYGYPYSRYYW